MGEKEMKVNTPLPMDYIEGDEEALETSFQALEIVGTTSTEAKRGDLKPSKAAIMVTKVLITNGFEPGKGLGRRLDGIAELVAIQENPGRAGLGYSRAAKRGKPGRKVHGKQQIRPNLYCYFTSGGIVTLEQIATIEDQLVEPVEWVHPMARELDNWTVEALLEPVSWKILNTETSLQINNTAHAPDETSKSSRQDEEEETEEEALKELEREIRIGKLIPLDFKQGLTKLLREYEDIFTWSYRDMPGLDTAIVEHRLPLIPSAILIQQQLRRMKPKVALKIKEKWVANIVSVPKKDEKVHMYVDYRDLNRASPKDKFPLPHIDLLVDNTTQHSCYSFMDGFSEYNQIRMALEDKEKTTFITTWGTFCYKVMPFGLKNVRATYQRAMVTLFHDMMHKEVEVYVDDMIAKSKIPGQHINDLRKLFERLQKYRLKLNPAKCIFGVRTGKLLGFIVNERGIKLDLDKVKAIQNMPAPKTEMEVRGFLGRVNYIARFIS
ncbi:hypothetical protein CR513_05617, partial [Mucuna pruriens]